MSLTNWLYNKTYTEINRLFFADLPLLLKVVLIAHHKLDGLLIDILLNLSNPTLHIIKWCSICYIIDYYYPISPSIIATGNRLKSILPSSIPLHHKKYTIWSLIFLPSTFKCFILFVINVIRNPLRLCCNSYVRIFYHYTVGEWNFSQPQSYRLGVP